MRVRRDAEAAGEQHREPGVRPSPPTRKHRRSTRSFVPDRPYDRIWHHSPVRVTAVTCATPPVMPIPGKITVSAPVSTWVTVATAPLLTHCRAGSGAYVPTGLASCDSLA